MEQCQAAVGESIIRIQKLDSKISKLCDRSVRSMSDMAGDANNGEAVEMASTSGLLTSGAKSSAGSLPVCQELLRARSVEKFVYETDSSKSAVDVHVDIVSNIVTVHIGHQQSCLLVFI